MEAPKDHDCDLKFQYNCIFCKVDMCAECNSGKRALAKGYWNVETQQSGDAIMCDSCTNSLKSEAFRLKTFDDWTSKFTVHALEHYYARDLARNGMYSIYQSGVYCAFCNYDGIFWRIGTETAFHDHIVGSPECPFLLGQNVGNQPITREELLNKWEEDKNIQEPHSFFYDVECDSDPPMENMKSESARLETFAEWSCQEAIPRDGYFGKDLALNGFYTRKCVDGRVKLAEDRTVWCAFCHNKYKFGRVGQLPAAAEHMMRFPACPLVLGQSVDNVPITRGELISRNKEHKAMHKRWKRNDRLQKDLNNLNAN